MILEIIESLRNTSGTKDKVSLLNQYKTNNVLKNVLIAAMTPNKTYSVDMIPNVESYDGYEDITWALEMIEPLTGSIDEKRDDYLINILNSLTEDDAKVIEMVLRNKINIGLKNKSLKQVWDDFPQDKPYNRCSSFSEKTIKKLKFPMLSQTKEDGMYVDIINGKTYTRAGNEVNVLSEEVINSMKDLKDIVFQGEVLHVDDNGNVLGRQESNGLSNRKEIDNTKTKLVLFDAVPLDEWNDLDSKSSKSTYLERWAKLWDLITFMHGSVELVECREVNNIDEVIEHFKENLSKGLEGTILKDKDAKWKNGTNPHMIKLKVECTVDLKVTGTYLGDKGTKNEHLIGGLNIESSDGLIKFNVGSGLTDEQRKEYLDGSIIGKIVEIKFNSITQNEDEPEKYALYLPRLKKVRDDKTEADTYEKVKESVESIDTLISNIFNYS